MTMDVQKMSDDATKPADQFATRTPPSSTSTSSTSSSVKRSFDVAFLMMPDERMKQKQLEKQLRLSKQLFADGGHYAAAALRHQHEVEQFRNSGGGGKSSIYAVHHPDDLKGTDLSTASYLRNNNNASPPSSEPNIDVGTDEFATKSVLSDSDVSDMSRSRPNSTESFSRPPVRVVHESPYRNKIFDDPSLMTHHARSSIHYEQEKFAMSRFSDANPRSAFTKVSHSGGGGASLPTVSPGHSESPDNLSYQNSMSPPLNTASPPALNNLFSQAKGTPFKSHPFLSSPHAAFFKQTYQNHHQLGDGTEHFAKTPPSPSNCNDDREKHHQHQQQQQQYQANNKFGHLLPSPYPYNFPMQNFHQHQHSMPDFLKFQQQGDSSAAAAAAAAAAAISPLIRNPAAAILSTLLPPTLATLSLPAQNVCAKCNISFRMTSDLVYHMRSHHKSDVSGGYDSNRRKREDKLKCPVCAESFRERHHLTRHMTAHQDKEGDILDHQTDGGDTAAEVNANYCPKPPKGRAYYGHANGLHHK